MLLKDQFSYQQHTLLFVCSLVYSPIFADTGHMTCTSPRSLSRPKSWRSGLKFFLNFFFSFSSQKNTKKSKRTSATFPPNNIFPLRPVPRPPAASSLCVLPFPTDQSIDDTRKPRPFDSPEPETSFLFHSTRYLFAGIHLSSKSSLNL